MEESRNNGFGLLTGTASALAFPDISADWMRIKAPSGNSADNYIGTVGNVVYPLSAGDDTGWFAVDNLSDIYYSGSGTYFSYWFQN